MAEQIIREYILKTDQFKSSIDGITSSYKKVEQSADSAEKEFENSFNKGSQGAKRFNDEVKKQPKTISELELRLVKLRELLRDDAKIGTEGFKRISNEIRKSQTELDKLNGKASVSNKTLSNTAKQGTGQFSSLTSSVKGFGAAMGIAFGAEQVISFTKDAIGAASGLNETIDKAGQIFGNNLTEVEKWAEGGAQAFGQSKQQALDAASTFAIFGNIAGKSGDDLVQFSTKFTELASDLASFNDTTPEDAIQAIGAALRGEAEPIMKYGVIMNEATLKQKALEEGIITSTKNALTPQQKVLAATALIYEKTSLQQGNFALTSDGLANTQRQLSAEFENAKVILGQSLLPTVLSVATAFNSLGAENFVKIIKTIVLAGGTFLAVTAATKLASAASAVYRTVTIALAGAKALVTGNTLRAAAAQRALGLSFASTPWGLIITLITTAAGALFFFSENSNDASEKQDELASKMDEVRRKAKEQEERVKRLNETWENFSGNKNSVSITDLRDAIETLNKELENTPVTGQRFTDLQKTQAFVIDQATQKLVENTDATVVYKETQEEANKRQGETIALLKGRKTALEEQLKALEAGLKTEEKSISALERANKELSAITAKMQNQILITGKANKADISRYNHLTGKLGTVKTALEEINKLAQPIEVDLDIVIPESLVDIDDPAKRFEASVKKRNEAQIAGDAEFLANAERLTELQEKDLEQYNLIYAGGGEFRVKTEQDELNEKIRLNEEFYAKGIRGEAEYQAIKRALNKETNDALKEQQLEQYDNAQQVLSLIGNTVSQIGGLINQVYDQQRENIDATLQTEIDAVNASTLSEEGKQAKIEALQKKAAKEQYDLQVEAFKVNKAIQISNTVIQTAQAVVAGLSAGLQTGVPGLVLGPVTAALAGALGAVQIGIIAASKPPPPPSFAKGSEFIQRGNNKPGIDTIPAYLNEGEAVIPTDKNRQYPGLAKAWIGGKLESYVNNVMLAPKLAEIERRAEERWMSKLVDIQGEKYDDMRMYMATTEGNVYLRSIAKAVNQNGTKKRTAW